MGNFKKEASRKEREGKAKDGMGNVKTKGENFYRNAKKVRQLNMFKEGKAQRNADGKILKAAAYQEQRCSQCSSGAQQKMVLELQSHFARCARVFQKCHGRASQQSVLSVA